MGVFVSGHGSIDYRLRDAESLRSTLIRFIQDLNCSLVEALDLLPAQFRDREGCQSAAPCSDPGTESESVIFSDLSDSDTESDTDVLLDSIRDPIDRLYKLSTRIRNPSSRLRSSKALRYQEVDDDTGVDLLQAYEPFDIDYVRSVFLEYRKSRACEEQEARMPSDANDSEIGSDNLWETPFQSLLAQHKPKVEDTAESFLVKRIVRANFQRRQQFAYWRKHRSKLAQRTSDFKKVQVRHTGTGSVFMNKGPLLPMVPTSSRHTPHSVTTATHLDITRFELAGDNVSATSITEYEPSVWQPAVEIIAFPDPPKHLGHAKFFECPYCFTLCSTKLLAPKAWKAHLIRDLRPYLCTHEQCRNPDQLYDTRDDWINHERSSHQKAWRCPDHPHQDFAQVDEYEKHLYNQHTDIPLASIPLIIRATESTLMHSGRCCPFCSSCMDDPRTLWSHIAVHLERFALFSFPRSIDTKEFGSKDGESDKVNFAMSNSQQSSLGERDTESICCVTPSQRWKRLLSGLSEEIKLKQSQEPLTVRKVFGVWLGDWASKISEDDVAYREAIELAKKVDHFFRAEEIFTDMVKWRKMIFGPEDPRTMLAMSKLSFLYMRQGRFVDSRELRKELLDIERKALGPHHPTTLAEKVNMAWIYWCEGDLRTAGLILDEYFLQAAPTIHKLKAFILRCLVHHALGETSEADLVRSQVVMIWISKGDNSQIPRVVFEAFRAVFENDRQVHSPEDIVNAVMDPEYYQLPEPQTDKSSPGVHRLRDWWYCHVGNHINDGKLSLDRCFQCGHFRCTSCVGA